MKWVGVNSFFYFFCGAKIYRENPVKSALTTFLTGLSELARFFLVFLRALTCLLLDNPV